jgi:hypothetical protein
VHGHVHLTGQQPGPQPADEHPGAADLGEVGPADVAEGGHPDQLGGPPGPLGDQVRHQAGLDHGHRAAAGADPERGRTFLAGKTPYGIHSAAS